ncbi:MAG: acyltransferase, partial [Sphingomonadales bacterium]
MHRVSNQSAAAAQQFACAIVGNAEGLGALLQLGDVKLAVENVAADAGPRHRPRRRRRHRAESSLFRRDLPVMSMSSRHRLIAMQTNPSCQKSPYIQWLRGLAAMAVVVFHASVYLARDTGDDRFSTIFGGIFGLMGVAIFFAISGALMADLLRRSGPDLFLAHRLARIYPAFAIVFLTVSMLNTGALHGDVRALSLGLVGRRADYVLGIEWTLVAEVFFYVLLYGLCTLRLTRWLEAFASLWLGAIVATTALTYASADGTLFPTLSQVLFLPANAAFAGGLLIPAII